MKYSKGIPFTWNLSASLAHKHKTSNQMKAGNQTSTGIWWTPRLWKSEAKVNGQGQGEVEGGIVGKGGVQCEGYGGSVYPHSQARKPSC